MRLILFEKLFPLEFDCYVICERHSELTSHFTHQRNPVAHRDIEELRLFKRWQISRKLNPIKREYLGGPKSPETKLSFRNTGSVSPALRWRIINMPKEHCVQNSFKCVATWFDEVHANDSNYFRIGFGTGKTTFTVHAAARNNELNLLTIINSMRWKNRV